MAAVSILVLSSHHIYPGIILVSIPRSQIAGSKAIPVLMSLRVLGSDHLLMYLPEHDSNSFSPPFPTRLVETNPILFF